MTQRPRAVARYLSLLLPAGVIAAALFGGCSDDGKEATGTANACLSNRQYFESQVWAPFMSQKCARCHTPDGEAVNEKGAKLVLQTASYPDFLEANLASLQTAALEKTGDKFKLLEKPIGGLNHGGGQVIEPGGPEHQALQGLVTRLQSGDPCPGAQVTSVNGAVLLDNAATARKAAIDLGGRLPTAEEDASVSQAGAAGDQALDVMLDALLNEETFYTRLREIYNDLLLTDRFLSYEGGAIDFMDTDKMYPSLKPYRDGDSPEYKDGKRPLINRALAREPLNLITYVARQNRPFTEILTANYTVVNPYSAVAYGTQVAFDDPTNENELKEVQVSLGSGELVPHAGVLSTPAFLNRWVTSPTNRNRGRARRVYQFFLATDILKIAERPVDPSSVSTHDNPTMTDKNCVMCHKIIDPIAGGFRGYDDSNYENFQGDRGWHNDMVPPGYGGTMMPPERNKQALPWMALEASKDVRFVISVITTAYTGLTGHKPLAYPTEGVDKPGHNLRVSAWSAQDAFFRKLGEEFVQSNYNVKTVFKGIIKSPYYRGKSLEAAPGDNAPLYEGIGTGRWLTPEILDRKITAVTSIPWRKYWEWGDLIKDKAEGKPIRPNRGKWLANGETLISDFQLLYGGMDSDNVPVRLGDPNGLSASVAWRMANEMSCDVTAWDFWKAKESRRFFPKVDVADRPEYNGKPVADSIAAIKENIVHLHKVFLGETVTVDDPEVQQTYALFFDTWKELSANEGAKEEKDRNVEITGECHARYDYDNLTAIPEDQQIRKDKDYTIRSWMAVITYLMLDYRFLYH